MKKNIRKQRKLGTLIIVGLAALTAITKDVTVAIFMLPVGVVLLCSNVDYIKEEE
jgi:hypothetical protein